MYLLDKLFTFSLCALSTLNIPGCRNALTSQDGTAASPSLAVIIQFPFKSLAPDASMIQDPYVKIVNVHYNGAVFAFPVGDVLVENGNTNQDTFGVWEQINLEDDLYAFKNRATGFYIVATGDDRLIAPPAEAPTVFQVTAADNDTYTIKVADNNLVWDISINADSNVGRVGANVVVSPDKGSDSQRWKLLVQINIG
ncbi:hypothetical protein C8J57DRAFT_1247133 [Mycena rebaudengoi]|nr:hypothetical protein C8J57DRAFT_1247133 [Mycena rebaudengoi]